MVSNRPLLGLELRRFKGINFAKLNLGRLTVLTGTNSAGKSSVLQAIALLEQSRGVNGEGLILNGPLVELGTFQDVLHDRVERGVDNAPQFEIRVRAPQKASLRFVGEASSLADFVPLSPQYPTRRELPWSHLQYVRADRLGPTLLHETSHTYVVRERGIGARGEYAVHYMLSHANDIVLMPLRLTGYADTLESQVSAWIDRISNDTRVYPKYLEGTSSSTLRFSNGTLSGLSGGGEHRATNVGFGLSYVLPIVVSCLAAQRGDVIMIENPEAHMHPRAQSQIANLCVRAAIGGAQVLLETHSEHVVNAVRIAAGEKILDSRQIRLYFFDRSTEDSQSIRDLRVLPTGAVSDWPSGFFDENMKSLLKLRELETE